MLTFRRHAAGSSEKDWRADPVGGQLDLAQEGKDASQQRLGRQGTRLNPFSAYQRIFE